MNTASDSYFQHYLQMMENPLPEIRKYFAAERDYLQKLVHSESSVLDVGSGVGRNTKDLAPIVRNVAAVDLDPRMVAEAKIYLAGDSNVLLFEQDFFVFSPTEQFDLVIASLNTLGGPIVHAYKRQAFLDRMVKMTKPGGHVVATFWNSKAMDFSKEYFPAIGVTIENVEENRVVTDVGVFKRFTEKEVHSLAKPLEKQYELFSLTDVFLLLDITV